MYRMKTTSSETTTLPFRYYLINYVCVIFSGRRRRVWGHRATNARPFRYYLIIYVHFVFGMAMACVGSPSNQRRAGLLSLYTYILDMCTYIYRTMMTSTETTAPSFRYHLINKLFQDSNGVCGVNEQQPTPLGVSLRL